MEGRQMAKTGRGTTARRNRNTVRNSREMYVQGNAVKRLQEVPRRTDLPDVQERRRLARERNQKSAVPVTPAKQAANRKIQRNREKAMAMNKRLRSVSHCGFHCGIIYLHQLSTGKIRNHGEYEKCCKSGI